MIPITRNGVDFILLTLGVDCRIALYTFDKRPIVSRIFGANGALIFNSNSLTIGTNAVVFCVAISVGGQAQLVPALCTGPAAGAVPTSGRELVHSRLETVSVPPLITDVANYHVLVVARV